ncbi:uncharacterized protein LOC142591214 [Dermacentor variabilis]|uniref:uncharacterized protein LOC142591214 n=1 Tax=Dermacentor variabilis TaxID=34621 RepID=UPI003F5C0920
MKQNIAIVFTTLLYILWASERIVPCSSLAARKFKNREPPKRGVGKFLYENRHLYLAAMSEVRLGPPIRCMESDFHWSAGGHVIHRVYYEQKVENTEDTWENKLLELAYTVEDGNKYVELTVQGITPPQPVRYQLLYSGRDCCIIGHQIPSPGGKTTCMMWSPEKEHGTLSSECKPTLEKYCKTPYNIPSRSVHACPQTQ